MGEKISMKWNEFEANVRESFKKLRDNHALFDVTLVSDDGHQIKAHKIVLSAGSRFFSDIFMATTSSSSNMLVYLKGIRSAGLVHVTDFLYDGEISIAKEELSILLETAHELGVKGLKQEELNLKDALSEQEQVTSYQGTDAGTDHIVIETEDEKNDALENIVNSFVVKNNLVDPLELKILQLIDKTEEGPWKCKVCGKTNAKRKEIRRHAEIHLEGVSHSCDVCGKEVATREALRKHISDHHSDPHSCDICGKAGMNRKAYYYHKRKEHSTTSEIN